MAVVVGAKGQVVIEKAIRDALGVQPGDTAVQRLVGDRVEIRFFPAEHDRSLRGVLEHASSYRIDSDGLDRARAQAWKMAAESELASGSRDPSARVQTDGG